MIKVPWTEHKKMKIYCRRLRQKEKLWTPLEVASRQKRWLGHILRHDSLLRITLEGQIEGKKNNAFGLATEGRGRQYQLYIRRTKDLKMSARDRSRWSSLWQSTTAREHHEDTEALGRHGA